MNYYIAYSKGSLSPYHYNGHRPTTLVIHAVRDIDCLPADIWMYKGLWDATKAELRRNKDKIRKTVNEQFGTAFTTVIVE